MSADLGRLLGELLKAHRSQDVKALLVELGDDPSLELGAPIGTSGLTWRPVGGNLSNLSTINLATKAGRSLTERITNAIDALLELRAHKSTSPLPTNPRQAASVWFGRPVSDADAGLFGWNYAEKQADRLIHVAMLESGQEDAPTVDVLDAGIGVSPEQMQSTVLSLQAGNKISKFHLIGSFGQGGSSTLAFCDYALYASRHADDPKRVGFTVIRVVRLGDQYKEDCYAYLSIAGTEGMVPVAELGAEALQLYDAGPKGGVSWTHGTLTRHVGFKLHDHAKGLQASPGNLYHFLHVSMFDPLLPFRLLDLREKGKEKDELVSGSRNRLMKMVERSKDSDEDDEARSDVRHYRPMEFVAPQGEDLPSIGIEYWVPLNYRKGKGKGEEAERVLRSSSNELFLQRGWPVVGSLNGQNQGEIGASFFKRLGLNMVSRHIVVHVDASRVPNRVRRELFSSTREGFKEGPVLAAIEKVLAKMLSEDEELAKVERELGEMIVHKENVKTEDEVKRQITSLLLDAGVSVREEGSTVVPGGGQTGPTGGAKGPGYRKRDPLPTLPFPDLTKWEMVVPADEMKIRLGDYETVLVETDADAEYDRTGRVAIRVEPPVLEIGGKAPLSGGRVRWRLRTAEGAAVGQTGNVIATITRPDGRQMVCQKPYRVLEAPVEPQKKAKGQVPPFEVLPIDPLNDEDRATWGQLWPDLADETDVAKLQGVAYKSLTAGGKTYVYFNVLFPPFRQAEDRYLTAGSAQAALYRVQYKIWIGYHALLQESDSKDERAEAAEDSGELVERTLFEETLRVATMQAKQAVQVVELRKQLLKGEPEGATQ